MPLDEQLRRLTQFVIGNQQNQFKKIFYVIFIGPAVFSALRVKFSDRSFQQKRHSLFRQCFHEIENQIPLKENM